MSAKINKIILSLFHFEEKNVGGPVKQVKKKVWPYCGTCHKVYFMHEMSSMSEICFTRIMSVGQKRKLTSNESRIL